MSHTIMKSFFAILLSTLSALVMCACAHRSFAVIVWPTSQSENFSQDVVRVRTVDTVENSVTLFTPYGRRVQLDLWRVNLFDTREQASAFLDAYSPYRTIFARCERRALPIRQTADRFSEIQYRLDRGEIIKVIQRAATPSDEAGFEDYWYEVITKTGVRGWVFGYYLTLVDQSSEQVLAGSGADAAITHILNNVWRPEYFVRMLQSGYIDTDRFSNEFGLFPAPLDNRITIKKQNETITFNYRVPVPLDEHIIRFGDRDTRLVITLLDRQTLEARYVNEGEPFLERYSLIEENIAEITNLLRAERNAQLRALIAHGNTFISNTDGTLRIADNGSFVWSRYATDSAAPNQTLPARGAVSLNLFLIERLQERFDGALSFLFTNNQYPTRYFTYRIMPNRLILTPVDRDAIRSQVVESINQRASEISFAITSR